MQARVLLVSLTMAAAAPASVPAAADAASRSCGTTQAKGSLPGGLGWEAGARNVRATGLSCASARSVARRLSASLSDRGTRPRGWRLRRTAKQDGFPRLTYARGSDRITFTQTYDEG